MEASNSDYLQRMFATLMFEVGMCLAALGSSHPRRNPRVAAEHQDILSAIKAGDQTHVAEAVNAHMSSAVKTLQAAIEDNELINSSGRPNSGHRSRS